MWHCVFVLSRGGYIAQWHRSTQVVQHSWDGQSAERRPPHQQTDGRGGAGKAPGTLQWKVAQRMSHSLRLIWFLQSERYCLVRNVTWAWIIFTQFSSSSVMEVISYWWTSERSFQVFINCWWVSWLNDVILICRIWIVKYLPTIWCMLDW